MTVRLSLGNLDKLPANVGVPGYRREDLSPGILHFGVGNFHRAHQAMYLDRLFSKGMARDWAIVGAGVMEGDKRTHAILETQDWLTTLVEQEAESSTAHVIGSMVDYLEPADAPAIIAALADPAIRIVSMTVTEGGYFLDAAGKFNPDHPAIAADAASPDAPKTLFGLIVAGLKNRRAAGSAPFTVMCCDNIPHNGVVTKSAVCGTARLSDPGLADWITENVAFPNSMVDRITPATTDRERALLKAEFGIEDGWPVFCEDFTQWVMEDDFPHGRPPFEEVGVQFVQDVTPYEIMKLRILNGGHATIAYAAGLLEVQFVHEAMEHPLVRPFLDKVETTEIVPVVPPVPGTDLGDYYALIARRFSNPKIADAVRRLCFDGSNKQAKFILGSAWDALDKGGEIAGLALQNALWCRYCFGTTESGAEVEPNDPNWDQLVAVARQARERPMAWLEQREVYGTLVDVPRFAEAFEGWLRMIWEDGSEAALRKYLAA